MPTPGCPAKAQVDRDTAYDLAAKYCKEETSLITWKVARADETMAARKNMPPNPTELPLYSDRRRVVFITGAARGIGEAIALRLARDGLDVVIHHLPSASAKLENVKKAVEKLGARCVIVVGDVTIETRVEQMVNEAVQALGNLDVMAGLLV